MPSNETRFYREAEACIGQILEENPATATFLGDHRFDERLADFTAEGIQRQRAMLGSWQRKMAQFDPKTMPLDARIDHTLTIHLLSQFIRGFDQIRGVERDPGAAVSEVMQGVYFLVLHDFAPLPERMKSILARLRASPKTLTDGRARIVPKDVPPVWAQIALESTKQSVGFFGAFLPRLAKAVPPLEADVTKAAQAAAAALQEHAAWIEKTVLPQAAGDFAVGKALFNEILREDHLVDYDADSLLKTGWRLLEETGNEMAAVARELDPKRTVKELLEEAKANHPAADRLLDTYREEMARARQFVVDHEIVTIPAGETLRIEPTPPFLRPLMPYAAYMPPGFLEKVQEGIFLVTPVEEKDPDAAERRLRGHPRASIPVTALHEAYPGHHLQLCFANQVGTLPRKLGGFLSTLFVEGWAFYCEELMERLGFIGEPIQKLSRLQAQMWRAARIVLDVSLHTGAMSVDEAIRFLVEKAGLEPDDAAAEVKRYTQSPTQPQSYLMGKIEILSIVEEYKRAHPKSGLREMHDAILGCGSLPPRLMRERLFAAKK
ncbi:MAG: DUF885 domain-containing protein [Candidatus Bipolaricaulota bacterium]|nr:DUF885 domain-containing protein [Candidatus Bipolaricaulota bacterium]